LKIVVNTRLLRKNQMDGIGVFAYNTLKYIVEWNPQIEFHFLFDSGIEEEFLLGPNVVPHQLFPPAKHAVLNVIWFEWSVKNILKKLRPDLFFSTDHILCLGWPGKQYCMAHDINFHHIPQDLKWSNRKYYNYFVPKCVHKATRLGTLSEYSKADVVNTYNVNPDKIDIVYCGINSFYEPVNDSVKRNIKEKYAGGADYFIFVGTLHPRKNILRLMQAFEIFKTNTASDMKLLLVGKEMYQTQEMYAYKDSMLHGKDVIFTGKLKDEELKAVFASASCLTFVSYFEGFGIPLIEAMQCDVPVITSNATSLPEVAGDAALIVDPYNVNDIAQAMERIVKDPLLRQQLIEKGRIRKNIFSWERTSTLLWNSISRIL
jgi:glycosyltransferase involved in cell wall biosynthesis